MYSKGISWIDDCRIPFVDENLNGGAYSKKENVAHKSWGYKAKINKNEYKEPQGRFPANILVSDDMLNDGVISKSNDNKWIGGMEKNWKGHTNKRIHSYTDKGSNSRYYDIDKWFNNLIDG
jgi:hypothetical protein